MGVMPNRMAENRTLSQAKLLRSVGLRTTQARVSVLAALTRSRGPLAAAALIEQLGGPIELTTIYRTLETLAKKGLVHRVRGADERAWSYAVGGGGPRDALMAGTKGGAKASHRHAHFVCARCGRIECLPAVSLPPQLGGAKLPDRYVLDWAEVVLHGRCAACR
jgi:Fur family ferric uptake transcriptional regulator